MLTHNSITGCKRHTLLKLFQLQKNESVHSGQSHQTLNTLTLYIIHSKMATKLR